MVRCDTRSHLEGAWELVYSVVCVLLLEPLVMIHKIGIGVVGLRWVCP